MAGREAGCVAEIADGTREPRGLPGRRRPGALRGRGHLARARWGAGPFEGGEYRSAWVHTTRVGRYLPSSMSKGTDDDS